MDIKAAFYSVVKQLLTDEGSRDSKLREAFMRMRLPQSVWECFVAHVEECSLVQQATRSTILAKNTQAMLSHTSFAVPDDCSVAAPLTGSRPGDRNADLLFGLLMARILKTLHERASQAGMPLFPGNGNGLEASNCVTWVDDIAISITSNADLVVTKMMHTLSLMVQDTMLEFGLQLSYGAGKTAAMVAFYGKGAVKARQSFESTHGDHFSILTEHQGAVRVPVVNQYKHLGGFVTKDAGRIQEIRIRTAATMAKLKPLGKILTNRELTRTMDKKRMLVRSMGLSVLT